MNFIKKNIKEGIDLLITLLIVLLLGTSLFELGSLNLFNYNININNIVAAGLLVLYLLVKNSKKTNMIVELQRFSLDELFYMIVYYIHNFSLIILFITIGSLNFLLGMIIVSLELVIVLSKFYVNYNQEFSRGILKYWKLKEIHLMLMFFLLILNNMPFEMYGLPIIEIVVITYIIIQANLIYKIYE